MGEFTELQELRDLEVVLPRGGSVKLNQLGTISDTFKALDELRRFRDMFQNVWIGTDSGLSQFNLLTGVWMKIMCGLAHFQAGYVGMIKVLGYGRLIVQRISQLIFRLRNHPSS